MIKRFQPKKLLTLLLAASLLVLPTQTGTANANEAVALTSLSANGTVSHFDYFSHVYENLNTSHVFKTATYEDIVNLFESEGTYAVLIGGSWSATTQADIGFINEAAKEYGVSTIYNFDTKLDGDTLQIAETGSPFAHKYVDLVNKYLTNLDLYDKEDPEHNVSYVKDGNTLTVNKIEEPFLFVYNKDHKDEQGNSAPIVASLQEGKEWSEFLTDNVLDQTKVAAYKEQVKTVLAAAPAYSTIDESAYIKAAFNKNYLGENAGKPTIFTSEDEDLVYEHVTYHQVKQILQSEGNYAILFGGSWCPNTQAVIKYINEYAKKHGVDKIYFFDTKLDSGVTVAQPTNNSGTQGSANPHNNNELQIRTTNHPYAKLYVDLVKTYLTNIKTENNTAARPTVISYIDEQGSTISGDRLQVPYLFTYNKDNKDSNGNSAPILGHVELMYSWTNIQPDAPASGSYPIGARYSNAVLALNTIFSKLEAVPSSVYAVAPTSEGSSDGQIVGTSAALEYKNVADTVYTPVTGTSITGLAAGTYQVRYAATTGYQGPTSATGATAIPYPAGESVNVVVPAYNGQVLEEQAAPVGLSGVAPSSASANNGKITGTTSDQEYKLSSAANYAPASNNEITGLTPGTYHVRYAAKPGYNAGAVANVVVPAYVSPSNPGTSTPAPTTPTTPTETEPSTPNPGQTVTLAATAVSTTDETTGVTTATASAADLTAFVEAAKKAELAGNKVVLEIKVEATAKTLTSQLTLPRSAFDAIAAGTAAEIKVNYANVGTIVFDAKSVASISGAAGTGDIHINIAKVSLTEEGKAVLGDRPVYDLSVQAGDSVIASFGGGEVNVSVPYTLQAGEDANAVLVYYINAEGSLDYVRGRYASGSVDFATTHFSSYIIGYNKVSFTDVSSIAWYNNAITFLAAREITSGTDVNHYSPNAAVTRGQFVVLLLKAYGVAPGADGESNFADAGSTYYTNYLSVAKRLGIATGTGDNQFKPNSQLTRQELFTLLHRALVTLGELPAEKTNAAVADFSDAGQISAYAQEAFKALVEGGIITGNNKKLTPQGVSTRAEVAQVLYQLLSK